MSVQSRGERMVVEKTVWHNPIWLRRPNGKQIELLPSLNVGRVHWKTVQKSTQGNKLTPSVHVLCNNSWFFLAFHFLGHSSSWSSRPSPSVLPVSPHQKWQSFSFQGSTSWNELCLWDTVIFDSLQILHFLCFWSINKKKLGVLRESDAGEDSAVKNSSLRRKYGNWPTPL